MTTTEKTYAAIVSLLLIGLFAYAILQSDPAYGSVEVSHEYTATTTAASTLYGNTITVSTRIKSGPGALGSVVLTGAASGIVNIYNATTSNVSLRTGQKATSTILLAAIPASMAAGTYTFDVAFTDGLYIDLVSGNMPTSTITYR